MERAARKIHQKQEQEAYFGKLIQQEQEYESQQQQLLAQLKEANKQFSLARQQELNFSLYEEWQSLKKTALQVFLMSNFF